VAIHSVKYEQLVWCTEGDLYSVRTLFDLTTCTGSNARRSERKRVGLQGTCVLLCRTWLCLGGNRVTYRNGVVVGNLWGNTGLD